MARPSRRRAEAGSSAELAVQDDAAPTTRSLGWRRLLQGNRVIWVLATVAILALVAGLALGQFITSPGEAAQNAGAPKPGLITVPVENRVLANDVTIRGDATYADSVDVTIETGEISGPAVVTGQVPAVGATFSPLSIAIEVAGRPVIVLPGDLPVYRTLRVGVAGPDVLQLKQALVAVGIDPGDAASDIFDSSTASAIGALYSAIGYPAPDSEEGTGDSVRSAADNVTAASDNLAAARRALAAAQSGPSDVTRIEQDNLVRSAERALATARAGANPDKIADAEDALLLAKAVRAAAFAPKDAGAESAAVNSAHRDLVNAEELLAEARTGTLGYLPSSEVLYLPGLPRRVDEITVQRGSPVSGAVMKVSGATLVLSASAARADALLIKAGDTATIAMPDGSEHGAKVISVLAGEGGGESPETDAGRYDVLLAPDALSPEQLAVLQGNNVRISIPVSSTDGEVMAVPLAALTAGAGGESRIEIATGDGDETRLVEVTTGLAAEGFVEVTAVSGDLKVDDMVVVGR